MTIRLFLAGDFLNTATPEFLDPALARVVAGHDAAVCNFEGPVGADGATPIAKAGPPLAQAPDAAAWLARGGITLCTLANNHAFDHGAPGLARTLEALGRAGIAAVGAGLDGATAYRPLVQAIGGVRVAFVAGCEAQFGISRDDGAGYAWIHDPRIPAAIAVARAEADFVVVLVHAGLEDTPLPLPEWRESYRRLCDAGASVVVAHHPHVPQGWERYRESLIFYSLGNFFFDTCGYERRSNHAYAVSLALAPGRPAEFRQVPIRRAGGRTAPADEPGFTAHLAQLQEWLGGDAYARLADQQAVRMFREIYAGYYGRALLGGWPGDKLAPRLLRAAQLVLTPGRAERRRGLLLLHNLRIESHRYATERALTLLYERGAEVATADFDAARAAMMRFC
jgi:hypothetical protein